MPTYKSYIIGFLLSIALTLGAYFAVISHAPVIIFVIIGLAMVQLLVQLIFFLHLGRGEDGHWNLVTLFSTFCVVFILVAGTIWIMQHLNYNMTPMQMDKTLMKMENMHK